MVRWRLWLRRGSYAVLAGSLAACGGEAADEAARASEGDGEAAALAAAPAGGAASARARGDGFAPRARIPGDVRRDPEAALEVGVIDMARVPSKDEVGVAPYPGAVIVGSTTAEEAKQMYGEEAPVRALVRLLSEDPPAAVAAFYRERLGGDWHHAEKFGSHYFWTGEPDLGVAELMDPARRRIQISEADGWRVLPGAKSDVFIVYGAER